jgi:hypothetical protein
MKSIYVLLFAIAQKRGHKPLPLGEKAPAPISSGRGRIVNLKCLFLSLLIRMDESPTRT